MSVARRVAQVSLFPAVMGGGLAAAHALMQAGVDPSAAVALVTVSAALLCIIGERLMPYTPAWNAAQGDITTDLSHTVVSMMALPELMRAGLMAGVAAIAGAATTIVPWSIWPADWPMPAQLVVALLLTELGAYWTHRWMHTHPLLWRLHATHHSAPRLYWLNAGRFHPLDVVLSFALQLPVLVLLGAPPPVIALFLIVTGVHGLFQHANLDVRLGPLNWVFSMAELHRWHHARSGPGARANYGANLIVWDVVFGTRYLPADRPPPTRIGFDGDATFPTRWWAQVASPFTWGRFASTAPPPGEGPPTP